MECSHPWASASVVLVLAIGSLLGGCGASAKPEGKRAYIEILHGLRRAAIAGDPYDAVGRAEQLKPVLRASVDAFCEVNREMLENREAQKAADTGYFFARIKLHAERELPFAAAGPVSAAVKEYRGLFGLPSFDVEDVRRYAKTCYR